MYLRIYGVCCLGNGTRGRGVELAILTKQGLGTGSQRLNATSTWSAKAPMVLSLLLCSTPRGCRSMPEGARDLPR